MTLIKDLIDLPDRVHRGDFVLKLSDGVIRPQETVANYVVTPQLVNCFDSALSLIRSALEGRVSKAAYLHGSFGSGKSHFMAILHLILAGDAHARSIPELASVIARHNVWVEGKMFLLVPYHMIGAQDMESALLGGYADHARRLQPEAPLAGVYRSDKILADALNLRASMGDAAFFARLNQSNQRDSGASSAWGEIGAGWDATSFDLAAAAPPKSDDRSRLVGDLVEHFFTAARFGADFVDLDTGLSIISKHARSLGYDGLILFLDELILWLASRAADVAFVNREGQKLAKLVEAQTADRPAPIISFVARQRDLKELVGDHITGAEKLSFKDVLGYWEARFATIKLEDRNLAAIAEKRILKPNSETSRQLMDDAFRQTEKIREEVMNVLLTSQANREMFRQTYPFSPALVETLVAVSSLLQRERTALKVMLQLLVEQRDHLKLGEIIPVGDLFDAISEGDEAFSDVMRAHFDNAKKLYHRQLRPLLEAEHKLSFDDLHQLPYDDLRAIALRNDDRLAKTLLLAALAPEVESLRNMTVGKLAALNHGTIKSPIPNREGQLVLNKCRKWAAEIGQIKIADDSLNPLVSIHLTGVDTQSIIEQAQSEDNYGNRVRLIKELLFGQLGVELKDEPFLDHNFSWRATRRSCEIVFGNVREMADERLINANEDWRVVIDFPFDRENLGPQYDRAKVEEIRRRTDAPSRTIVWIPSFFSHQAQDELGTLVKLEHILTGERFANYVTRLSPQERSEARTLLENQRSQLKQRIIGYLQGAYGIANPETSSIDQALRLDGREHFESLDPAFNLAVPVGANLRESFEHLLHQALKFQFPAHPQFDPEVRINTPMLRRVFTVIEQATQAEDGRVAVDQQVRKEMRLVANPLRLGEMAETHFVLGVHWKNHFLKKEAEHQMAMTVGALRRWMDEPQAMGLPRELQNLVILSFAAHTNRSFALHDGPFLPTVENLPDELTLREQQLPAQTDWDAATARGAAIFGVTASQLLNATNLAKFIADIRKIGESAKTNCDRLVERLQRLTASPLFAGMPAQTVSSRLQTARATKALIDSLSRASENQFVETLARAEIITTEAAMGTSLKSAPEVLATLEQADGDWQIFEALRAIDDQRRAAAHLILDSLKTAFQSDELAVKLNPAMKDAKGRAARLLIEPLKPQPTTATPTTAQPAAPQVVTGEAGKVLARGTADDLNEKELERVCMEILEKLRSDADARMRLTWEVYIR
ncbi:MAG: phage resistance protein [Acidobacteria bacterium]|nr:phage resistance protein [Acidobacteriota bacterium]